MNAAQNKTVDHEFLAFLGFEFRGPRGDTAVIFKDGVDYSQVDDPTLTDIGKVWAKFPKEELITIPHYHNPGSLPAGQWIYDSTGEIETVQEIFSCHGSYEDDQSVEQSVPRIKSKRKDRYGRYMLNEGYQYGLVCNSDGHKGNPGTNGLIAVYAKALTKDDIFTAIKKRQVYGTTNARIKLLFTVDEQLMGSTVARADILRFHIDIQAEGKIKYVAVVMDGQVVERFAGSSEYFRLDGQLKNMKRYVYVKVVQMDNHIAYSSPVFIEDSNDAL